MSWEIAWTRPAAAANRLLRLYPIFSGGVAIVVATAALVASSLGLPQLTAIVPGLPEMGGTAALMALISGLALILTVPAAPLLRRRLGKLCAGVVGLSATLTLAEYLFGFDLGLEVIVAPEPLPDAPFVGHASPQTAAAFLLLTASLLLSARTRVSELLAFAAGLIPFSALLGYLFGIAAFYVPFSPLPYATMSLPSAVAALVLSTGAISLHADSGALAVLKAEDSGGIAARQLLGWLFLSAPVALVIALGAWIGLYPASFASALIVLLGTITAILLGIRLARRLSRLDSERQRAQDQVQRAQERFELALRGADLGAWDWNVKSGEVIFSSRWAEMRGYRLEEIEPRVDSWMSGVHPDDRPRVQQAVNDYFQALVPEYQTEHRVLTRSGDYIWVLDRGKVFARDEHGQPLRMVGTELDITERKRLEEELALSEAKSSGILAISADGIISIDEAQRITSLNEGAEKIFGYCKNELIGEPLELLIPERFRTTHRGHVESFVRAPITSRRMGARGLTITGLRKNGEEFPADATISKLEIGGTTILTVALRDITEQKRRADEQALLAEVGAILASSFDYADVLASTAEAAVRSFAELCLVDLIEEDGSPRRLKTAYREPGSAWLGQSLLDIPANPKRQQEHPVWSVLTTMKTVVLEKLSPQMAAWLSLRATQDEQVGAMRIGSLMVVPLVAHAKLLGAITLVRSTSTRPFARADVELAEELARTAALSLENALLYRKAQRAIQARDEILAIVAHDLRNPLGTILMQATLLGRRGSEPERRSTKPAEILKRAVKRMNHLIQDLLDVTRMEAGRLSLEQSNVSPEMILSECLESEASLAAAASLELRLDLVEELPDVWADHDRLLQIFENLVGNAIKFTPTGGRVTVGAVPDKRDVLFWVSDTGAGIAAEDLPHVFDRFWQAQKSGRRGAGLGLPIVKGLVEAHGGRIWVESTLGHGTTFFFTIPQASVKEQSGSEARAS